MALPRCPHGAVGCVVVVACVLGVYRGPFNGLAYFSPQFYYSINFRDRVCVCVCVCADGARRRLSFGGVYTAHVVQRRRGPQKGSCPGRACERGSFYSCVSVNFRNNYYYSRANRKGKIINK